MFYSKYTSVVCAFALLLAAAGCSDDGGTEEQLTDTDTTNNSAPDASEEEEDTGPDATDEADAQADSGAEEDVATEDPVLVPSFTYTAVGGVCPTQVCEDGVSVNIISGRIGDIQNGQSLTEDMTDDEIDELEADYLNDHTHAKLRDGFDCGDTTEIEGESWLFEAQILLDSGDHDRVVLNVTGCVPDDSSEADAQHVQDIIAFLDFLRDNHFDPR
jgi:hypothetical protein